MIFGKCVWIPPSPKAALLALSYFYGIAPGVPPAEYEEAIRGQLVAAGAAKGRSCGGGQMAGRLLCQLCHTKVPTAI